MDFKYGDSHTNIPENAACWTDMDISHPSIPVPVAEFPGETYFFSDMGSLPPSDADFTPTSLHVESSGFREASHNDITMVKNSYTATLNNVPNEAEAFAVYENTESLYRQNHEPENGYSDRPRSFPRSELNRDEFLETLPGEATYLKNSDSNELNINCESSPGFDELAKTIIENCSVDDLMNLPLDENMLENNIQGESYAFKDQRPTESLRNGGKRKTCSCHKGYSHGDPMNASEARDRSLPSERTTTNAVYTEPWVSNQEVPIFTTKGVNSQDCPQEPRVRPFDVASGLPGTELGSITFSAPRNPPLVGVPSKSLNTSPSVDHERNLNHEEMKSNSFFGSNTSSTNTAMPLNSSELITNEASVSESHVFNRKGNKNMQLYRFISTPENSMNSVKETYCDPQETRSKAQFFEDGLNKKAPILKFKRLPGSTDFFVSSKSSTPQAPNLYESQVGKADRPNYTFDRPRVDVLSSMSTSAGDGMNGGCSSSPLSAASSGPAAKTCGVCGDVAKSMHFGGMACDSCKAFFRRSVQGKYWKKFNCSGDKSCAIGKLNRRSCQFCRFAKCRKNGMKISWVMTEEERLVLWKKRLTKHQQDENDDHVNSLLGAMNHCSYMNRKYSGSPSGHTNNSDHEDRFMQSVESKDKLLFRRQRRSSATCKCNSTSGKSEHPRTPPPNLIITLAGGSRLVPDTSISGTSLSMCSEDHPLSDGDRGAINKLIHNQNIVFSRNRFSKVCEGNTVEAIYNIHINICEKLSSYLRENEDLRLFSRADQIVLFRNGFIASLILHGLYNFDENSKSWPRKSCMSSIKVPCISSDILVKFTSSSSSAEKFINFCLHYNKDVQDEGVLAIMLILSVVYDVESPHELENEISVAECRNKYLNLLIRYLRFRQGEKGYIVTLPRLLAIIPEAKKLAKISQLTQIDMSSSVHFAKNMIETVELVKDLIAQPLPPYSSVTVSSVREADGKEVDHARMHHPVTNAIFGHKTQVDALLLNPIEQMLRYEDGKLMPDGHQLHENSLDTKLESALLNSDEEMERKASVGQENINSGTDCGVAFYGKATRKEGGTEEDTVMWSEEKKVGIQVLCEVLQSLVESDDPRTIELLRESLPSELNLNPR